MSAPPADGKSVGEPALGRTTPIGEAALQRRPAGIGDAGAAPLVAISSRSTTRLLAVVVTVIMLASAFDPVMRFGFGHDYVYGLVPFARGVFYVDNENNFSTWFASWLLFFAALLLAGIGLSRRQARRSYAPHWLGLAALFAFLSVDEVAGLHDKTQDPLNQLLGATGIWHHTWVVLGVPLVIVVGAMYVGFLRALPPRTRAGFLAAAALYVGGALGFEMISGHYASQMGPIDWPGSLLRAVLAHIEELLEMIGLVVFVHVLLGYLREHVGPVCVQADE